MQSIIEGGIPDPEVRKKLQTQKMKNPLKE
jgi:hypothetical protein